MGTPGWGEHHVEPTSPKHTTTNRTEDEGKLDLAKSTRRETRLAVLSDAYWACSSAVENENTVGTAGMLCIVLHHLV